MVIIAPSNVENNTTITKAPVWDLIQETAQWGLLEENNAIGVNRQSLTNNDKKVRDWFVTEVQGLGCEVKVDQMGNIFAILPGENSSLPPIGIGSHLDTQPAGGRFDGILGVIAGLQTLRTVKESGIKTYAPLAAINWTNEEGSRFNKMCSGSGVWSGTETLSECYELKDITEPSVLMGEELKRIGYLGATPCSHLKNKLSAHFELHIEQGSRLENSKKKIAAVTGVQGMRWYEVHCQGNEAHAGATPIANRADALVPLALLVAKVEALSQRENAFGTVGVLTTGTSSPNTVPGSSYCTIDVRHPSDDVLDLFEEEVRNFLAETQSARPGIEIKMKRIWRKRAVQFDHTALACVRQSALEVTDVSLVDDLISFAGHDSAETAQVVPTAMVFVPSRGGISHNPAEYTCEEDCELGAEVLLKAILKYDSHLRLMNGI